jgi:hypothetical protein
MWTARWNWMARSAPESVCTSRYHLLGISKRSGGAAGMKLSQHIRPVQNAQITAQARLHGGGPVFLCTCGAAWTGADWQSALQLRCLPSPSALCSSPPAPPRVRLTKPDSSSTVFRGTGFRGLLFALSRAPYVVSLVICAPLSTRTCSADCTTPAEGEVQQGSRGLVVNEEE